MAGYEHWSRFRPTERLVKEFEYWLVVTREKQVTLGSCLLLLKRAVPCVGEMTTLEAGEFPSVASWFENTTKNTFGAEKFNYIMAMMKDPWVHYHAFPRYSRSITKFGVDWIDDSWPKVVKFKNVFTDEAVLHKVKNTLREYNDE